MQNNILDEKLRETARRIYCGAHPVLKAWVAESATFRAFPSDGIISFAWEAFMELGGDPNHPELFDWEFKEFFKLTITKARKFYRNDSGMKEFDHQRHTITFPVFTWDAWDKEKPTDSDTEAARSREILLADFLCELQHALSTRTRASGGHSGERQFALLMLYYQLPENRDRLNDLVRLGLYGNRNSASTRLSKSRQRARVLMDPKWREIAKEILAT